MRRNNGNCCLYVSRWRRIVEIDVRHWAVLGAPLVALAGLAIYFLLRRHKETPPDDHIFK